MIKITSKKAGFRRCGLVHTGTILYGDDVFSPDILMRLKAEPLLIVEEGLPEELDVPKMPAEESVKEAEATSDVCPEQALESEATAENVEQPMAKGKSKK